MKIGELVKRTQTNKQTIHHYIQKGVLRKPRKRGRNTADYGERYVEQIQIIKDLQKNHFLPLAEIKKILQEQRRSNAPDHSKLQFHSEFFKPLDRLLPDEIVGKLAFRKETGLSAKWHNQFEEWNIITPKMRKGKWVYSHDNVIIGKLIVEMGKIGFGPKDGFNPERLKQVSDVFRNAIDAGRDQFMKSFSGVLSPDEMQQKAQTINELMGIYYYHLYRKFSNEQN